MSVASIRSLNRNADKNRRQPVERVAAATIAVTSFGFVAWAVSSHPAGLLLPGAVVLAYWVVLWRWPAAWLIAVPALLPVIDQATTTGDIYTTESDILLAATIAFGFTRFALLPAVSRPRFRRAARVTLIPACLLALLTISYAISAAKGFLPYVAFEDQLAGYNNRWNSFRVGKSFLFSLMLVPLLVTALREQGDTALKRFMTGVVVGLGAVCLSAVYERMAYVGLMDLASDYRITGPFWEMHVGGAALDGWLALTLPFIVWAVKSSRRWYVLLLSLALGGTAIYVALATFSRGVYGACVVSALVLFAVEFMRMKSSKTAGKSFAWLLVSAVAFWALWEIFHSGGYRTMATAVVLFTASSIVATLGAPYGKTGWATAAIALAVGGAVNAMLYGLLEKGAYWAFALASTVFACGAGFWLRKPSSLNKGMLLGMWGVSAIAGALVALHWGGTAAGFDYLILVLALALVLVATSHRDLGSWHWTPRFGAFVFAGATVLALGVAMTSGYYIGERFSQTQDDFHGRERHWRQGIGWLESPGEKLLGKGLGRFPDVYFWSGSLDSVPGTFSFPRDNGNTHLKLTSARHELTWGDMLRVLQPVSLMPQTRPIVSFDARVTQPVTLHLEVCVRHLLYAPGCMTKGVNLQPGASPWQKTRVALDNVLEVDPWYAPRRTYFAAALYTKGATIELDNLELIDGTGQNKLRNGDFSQAQDFWFFSSDRDHLPWHIKNLFLNVMFDQGLLGLMAFFLFFVAVAVRALKYVHDTVYAPYLLSALAGFFVVGLFDSLLDVPRLATLFFLMCYMMLVLSPGELRARRPVVHSGNRQGWHSGCVTT